METNPSQPSPEQAALQAAAEKAAMEERVAQAAGASLTEVQALRAEVERLKTQRDDLQLEGFGGMKVTDNILSGGGSSTQTEQADLPLQTIALCINGVAGYYQSYGKTPRTL